jgi:tetratricopeptide (TPR) repeat protein
VAAESVPSSSPALDPQTWVDLLTVYALKSDVFSTRTLSAIHEGVEKLDKARIAGSVTITNLHVTLFERLQKSFNNPHLLKQVGAAYLVDFRMPGVAQKLLDLASQLAPKDRDIEELQVAAALGVAREMTKASGHSGIDEAATPKAEVGELLRKTVKLAHIADARTHLNETAGEMGRQQEEFRQTGGLREVPPNNKAVIERGLVRTAKLIAAAEFSSAAAALHEVHKAGAPKEEVQAYYAQIGLTAYDHAQMDEALSAFLRLRDLAPQAVEGWFNCGLVYQKMGRLDEGLASYQKAARLEPENAKTWCSLSSILFERGEAEEAEKAARRCLSLKTNYARAWDNLASALSAQHRLPEAADACQHAVRLNPTMHSAWFKYGVINFQLDNMALAGEAFNMVADDPNFQAYVLYYLAMIEARRGELDLAVEKLTEGRAIDSRNEMEISALQEVATAFATAGKHAAAADFYRQVTDETPDDFSAWLTLGTSRHRADQKDLARAAYIRATELRPESALPWHNLGLLASDQGKHEEARTFFQREVELAPEDAKAWYDLGVSLRNLGHKEESAEAFERAETLVSSLTRRSDDLSAALSIVRRLNLSGRVLKME